MIATTQDMLFLKAENKEFKKGQETVHFTQATFLDAESIVWEMTVDQRLKEKVMGMEERTMLKKVAVELYKVKFDGKESIKMRLADF